MAPLISVQLNVTDDGKPVALFAGARSVVCALLVQGAPLVTVIVNDRDTVEGQSPKRASTNQLSVPCGTGALSCVAPVVVPIRNVVFDAVLAVEPQTR